VRGRIDSKYQVKFILNEARDLKVGVTFKRKDAHYRSPWRSMEDLGLQATNSATQRTNYFCRALQGEKNNYGELFKPSQ